MNPKYKDFENWALKNNWFFIEQSSQDFYRWLSPAGLGFTIIVDGGNITAHNSPFDCNVRIER